ncbi:MAG: hypothetical protein ACPGVB_03160 [Chitinophagales bacterium]
MNKILILLGLLLVTMWDIIATIVGTVDVIGTSTIEIFIAVLFTIVLSGFLLSTMPIMKNPKDDFVSSGSKFLWFLALCYDLFINYIGNKAIITLDGEIIDLDLTQIFIITGLTLFVTSAPILVSYLIYD